ncbi:Macrophage colony-stimulating factor 1 receptor [Basidiobolus ranarum]|uniref:Macrophage colony-stimulating factor 1 receptor n=1 Tax=Basidiobolus ranarum TaxID=34480 RepID=A0ABR2VRG9_9FUNG
MVGASGVDGSADSNEAFITFLIYCLVVVTVVFLLFLVLNRVFAQILSKIINMYTWKKYRAYFEIDSLQFSLLGGRVLFKNFRYYSRNQSIFILQGHITFRYWFLRVREEKSSETLSESSIPDNATFQERREGKEPPCRIKCEVKGLEWFMYNRTPVYDIIEEIINPTLNRDSSVLQGFDCGNSEENITVNFDGEIPPADTESSMFRKMLPIQFECDIGSITVGNNDLPTILITNFSQATGVYSAAKPSSPLDYYKSVLNMDIISPKISCRINVDYNGDGEFSILTSRSALIKR